MLSVLRTGMQSDSESDYNRSPAHTLELYVLQVGARLIRGKWQRVRELRLGV